MACLALNVVDSNKTRWIGAIFCGISELDEFDTRSN